MADNTTLEVLFHGLMVFNKIPDGPFRASFLRGTPENPLPDHVVSVTLLERPGRAQPGDILPFPLPLLLSPTADIDLRVVGDDARPVSFEEGNLIILNGPGFNEGKTLTIGDRFAPHFWLHNGTVSSIDNREVIVLQSDDAERRETCSFIVMARIAAGRDSKIVLTCGDQTWEFFDLGDGTTYRLWVSNLPAQTKQEHEHHLQNGHFHFYYSFGFPEIDDRFDLKPLTASGRSSYERPCLGIGKRP